MFTPITLSTALHFTREQPDAWFFVEHSNAFGWSPFECTSEAVARSIAADQAAHGITTHVVKAGVIEQTYES